MNAIARHLRARPRRAGFGSLRSRAQRSPRHRRSSRRTVRPAAAPGGVTVARQLQTLRAPRLRSSAHPLRARSAWRAERRSRRVGVSVVHWRSWSDAHNRHRLSLLRGKKLADFERDSHRGAVLKIDGQSCEQSSQRCFQAARSIDSLAVVFPNLVPHEAHTSHTIRCYPYADPHVLPLHA